MEKHNMNAENLFLAVIYVGRYLEVSHIYFSSSFRREKKKWREAYHP